MTSWPFRGGGGGGGNDPPIETKALPQPLQMDGRSMFARGQSFIMRLFLIRPLCPVMGENNQGKIFFVGESLKRFLEHFKN